MVRTLNLLSQQISNPHCSIINWCICMLWCAFSEIKHIPNFWTFNRQGQDLPSVEPRTRRAADRQGGDRAGSQAVGTLAVLGCILPPHQRPPSRPGFAAARACLELFQMSPKHRQPRNVCSVFSASRPSHFPMWTCELTFPGRLRTD